jgi:hypothetical protein
MTTKVIIILSIFFFCACHPQINNNSCSISTDAVLSCIASSSHLSTKEISTKFDTLTNPTNIEPDSTKLNKVVCLSLHSHASKKQLEKGESILKENLKQTECNQQNLSGLLHIIQGKINLYNKYLDKNWDFYLKKKKINKEQETDKLELKNEIISYQRRIKDLEQQVQKLKEIESMLDKKSPQ